MLQCDCDCACVCVCCCQKMVPLYKPVFYGSSKSAVVQMISDQLNGNLCPLASFCSLCLSCSVCVSCVWEKASVCVARCLAVCVVRRVFCLCLYHLCIRWPVKWPVSLCHGTTLSLERVHRDAHTFIPRRTKHRIVK